MFNQVLQLWRRRSAWAPHTQLLVGVGRALGGDTQGMDGPQPLYLLGQPNVVKSIIEHIIESFVVSWNLITFQFKPVARDQFRRYLCESQ